MIDFGIIHQIPMHLPAKSQFVVNSVIGSSWTFQATISAKATQSISTSAVDHLKEPDIIAMFSFFSVNKAAKSTLIHPTFPTIPRWIEHRRRPRRWLICTTWKWSKETSTKLSTMNMCRNCTLSWLARSWTKTKNFRNILKTRSKLVWFEFTFSCTINTIIWILRRITKRFLRISNKHHQACPMRVLSLSSMKTFSRWQERECVVCRPKKKSPQWNPMIFSKRIILRSL